MNRTDLQQLAEVRLAEAEALLTLPTPLPDGAYYLAGYTVECALKACIAKMVSKHEWPDKAFVNKIHTHDTRSLIRSAQLETTFLSHFATDADFNRNWTVVESWNEQSRYDRHSLAEATALVIAVGENSHGVLPWIKTLW